MATRITAPQPKLHFLPPRGSRARRVALLFLWLMPLFFGGLALYLGQDVNWDFRNYHWYNAYAFVTGRIGHDLVPSQIPSFYNPLLDVPFYLAASILPAKAVSLGLGIVQGLNFVLLFMLAHATLIVPNPRHKVFVCAFLAALGLLGGGGIALIGTTFYDNVTSLGFFASALLVLRLGKRMTTAPATKALGLAFLCGLPVGLMMGLKLPSVIFCVGLCGALLFVTGPFLRRVWLAFGFGLGILAALTVSLGPWAWHLYQTTGNPLFPYFNDLFHSPLMPEISSRDVKFIPGGWERLTFPFIIAKYPLRTGEVPWQDFRLPLLYVLLPLGVVFRLLFGRNRQATDRVAEVYPARYLLWAAVLSYIPWLLAFAIYRYVIPLEMLAPLLLVLAMGLMPIRTQPRALLTCFVLVAVILSIQPADWGRAKGWTKKYVSITHPPLPNSDETMILMAGLEPYSYVLSEFPPKIPFIRIQSNLASPDEGKGITKLAAERIKAHKGIFKMLIPTYQLWFAETSVKHFNLTFLPQSCQPIVDHLYDSSLVLCDVMRQKTKGKP